MTPPAPSEAAMGRETFITMVADRDEYITGGTSEFFHPGNSWIEAGWDDDGSVYAQMLLNDGTEFYFAFIGRFGVKLREGTYAVDQPKQPGQPWDKRSPGLSIQHFPGQADSRFCHDGVQGRFIVKDIVRSRFSHRIKRLWIVYEQRCRGGSPLSGEIRYRMPSDGGQLVVGPRAVRYPTIGVGQGTLPTPVRAFNTSTEPITVTDVSLFGGSGHSIRYDGCSNWTIPPGQSCAVWLRFEPSSEGAQYAVLQISEGSVLHWTRVNGRAVGFVDPNIAVGQPGGSIGGTTSHFTFESEPGDPVGGGQSGDVDLDFGDYVVGDHRGILAVVQYGRGEQWALDFIPPLDDVLLPGMTYSYVSRVDPYAQWSDRDTLEETRESAGMHVTHLPHECEQVEGSFTIHALRLDESDEVLELDESSRVLEFAASFEQFCDGSSAALRGRVDIRR